eukprot:4446721-Pyramimonas_sp.AAC.1
MARCRQDALVHRTEPVYGKRYLRHRQDHPHPMGLQPSRGQKGEVAGGAPRSPSSCTHNRCAYVRSSGDGAHERCGCNRAIGLTGMGA